MSALPPKEDILRAVDLRPLYPRKRTFFLPPGLDLPDRSVGIGDIGIAPFHVSKIILVRARRDRRRMRIVFVVFWGDVKGRE